MSAGKNICYPVAVFFILFNLICIMPSEKVEFLPTDPIPRVGGGGGSAGKVFATMLLHP